MSTDEGALDDVGLRGFVNLRDLGGYAVSGGRFRPGLVYRSDSLAHVEPSDVDHLVDDLGIRTVIDLRGPTEIARFPNDALVGRGVALHHIPLLDPDRPQPDELADPRTRTLPELYRFILTSAGDRLVEGLRLVGDPDVQPVVFHCAAGKDRTGLLAALVLGLLGADDATIVDDYTRTALVMDLVIERARRRAGGLGVAVSDQLLTAEEDTMVATLEWLRQRWGSFEEYVALHGFGPVEVRALRGVLVEPDA